MEKKEIMESKRKGIGYGPEVWEEETLSGREMGQSTEKKLFSLLNWFCLECKLVAIELNEARGHVLCDLYSLLKLYRISCQF